MSKSIDEMIRVILVKKDISQQSLATQLKVAPSQITRWRTGDSYPGIRNLDKIKQLYAELTV